MLIEMRIVKARLRKFSLGTRNPLPVACEVMCVKLKQVICLYFTDGLRLPMIEITGSGLINLVGENSKQHNIQPVSQVLFAV